MFGRHVERTKLLLFVVDVNGFQLSPDRIKRTAFETIAVLNRVCDSPFTVKKFLIECSF